MSLEWTQFLPSLPMPKRIRKPRTEEQLERGRAYSRKHYLLNRERLNEKKKAAFKVWYSKNKDTYYEQKRRKRGQKKWEPWTKAKAAAAWRKYNALKISRIHPDHNKAIELQMDETRVRISRCTGITFNLDHIIPLAGNGIHHHQNLQVLPAQLNRRKGKQLKWENDTFFTWESVPTFLWPKSFYESAA